MKSSSARSTLLALCLVAPAAWAVEYGTVLSSTPMMAAVPQVQRQCIDEPVTYQRPSSGAGALIGAIAGAAVGNSFGSGAGRAAATGLGMVAGAAIGDRVEADGASPVTSTVQRCRSVTTRENRLVGYDVVYEYQGVRRSVRLAQDPGARIALEVVATPMGAVASAAPGVDLQAPPAAVGYITPADTAYESLPAQVVYETPPARAIYAPPPRVVYPASAYISVNPWPAVYLGTVVNGWRDGGGYRGHHGHHGYRH